MKIRYDKNNDRQIGEHEEKMREALKELIAPYKEKFKEYGCKIRMDSLWSNAKKGVMSEKELPYKDGYECRVGYVVEWKQQTNVFQDNEDDPAEMEGSWKVTRITRNGLFLDVEMEDDIGREDIQKHLEESLKTVKSMYEAKGKHSSPDQSGKGTVPSGAL